MVRWVLVGYVRQGESFYHQVFCACGAKDAFVEDHLCDRELPEGLAPLLGDPLCETLLVAEMRDTPQGEVRHKRETLTGKATDSGTLEDRLPHSTQWCIVRRAHPDHTGSIPTAKEAGTLQATGERSVTRGHLFKHPAQPLDPVRRSLPQELQRNVHLLRYNPADLVATEMGTPIRQKIQQRRIRNHRNRHKKSPQSSPILHTAKIAVFLAKRQAQTLPEKKFTTPLVRKRKKWCIFAPVTKWGISSVG